MNLITLDIIIPSFRLDEKYLIPTLSLAVPDGMEVKFIIVADNPRATISDDLEKWMNEKAVTLIRNAQNLGASATRNAGLERASADWILFLDDDIFAAKDLLFHYRDFIQTEGEGYMGAVGLTRIPAPFDSFTRGIHASDILTFFFIANWYDALTWGVTANILVKRSAVDGFRFSLDFPAKGGGEDIDLFIRMYEKSAKQFKCFPEAVVDHPWWGGGKRNYQRFFRWAFGDSRLPVLYPQHRFFNFPNVIESFLLGVCASIILGIANIWWLIPGLLLGPVLGDFSGEWIKIVTKKQIYSPIIALESAIVRGSNDLGRMFGNISRGRIAGILERFDYFCDGKHIADEKKWAAIKFSLMLFWVSGIALGIKQLFA